MWIWVEQLSGLWVGGTWGGLGEWAFAGEDEGSECDSGWFSRQRRRSKPQGSRSRNPRPSKTAKTGAASVGWCRQKGWASPPSNFYAFGGSRAGAPAPHLLL